MATIFVGLGLIIVGIIGIAGGIENMGTWWSLALIAAGVVMLLLSMNDDRIL